MSKDKDNRRRSSSNSQEGDDKSPRNRQGSASIPSQANMKKRKSLTTRKSSGVDIKQAV